MKLFKKAKKGFTLVELVVVIAVIAILAAVSVGAYFGVTESANKSRLEQEVKSVHTAIQTVALAPNDHSNFSRDGLIIKDVNAFEEELENTLGKKITLALNDNKKSDKESTIYFSSSSYQEAFDGTTVYKSFSYYIPEVNGMKVVTDVITGKSSVAKGTFETLDPEEGKVWYQVNDVKKLEVGDTIVIAAKDSSVAMSNIKKDNNRPHISIEKSGIFATLNDQVLRITLEEGKVANTFAFNTELGYLYAASSSSNHLKTQTTLNENGSWKIENVDGVISIVAQGDNTSNSLRYNKDSDLFSCYASGQEDIVIYSMRWPSNSSCEHDFGDNLPTCTFCGEANPSYYSPEVVTKTISELKTIEAGTSYAYKVSGYLLGWYGSSNKKGNFYLVEDLKSNINDAILVYGSSLTTSRLYYAGSSYTYVSEDDFDFESFNIGDYLEMEVIVNVYEDNNQLQGVITNVVHINTPFTVTISDGINSESTSLTNNEVIVKLSNVNAGANINVLVKNIETVIIHQTGCVSVSLTGEYEFKYNFLEKTVVATLLNGTDENGVTTNILKFNDSSLRTSFSTTEQIWETTGIKFTNSKSETSSNIADYVNPIRIYKESKVIIEFITAKIDEIIFTANSDSYATTLYDTLTDLSGVTKEGNLVKIEDFTSNKLEFNATGNQIRLDSIAIKYTEIISPEELGISSINPENSELTFFSENSQVINIYDNNHNYVSWDNLIATFDNETLFSFKNGTITPYTNVEGTVEILITLKGSDPIISTKVTVKVNTINKAVFSLGDNGAASHNDGSEKTTYSETVNGYTLNITKGSKMYTVARDAKGNSCIKFGTSSAAGSMTFTVPDDVTKVTLYVAKYKSNTSKIKINNTSYTLTKNSNDGEYDVIEVDTSSIKTISFETESGGYRAMLNTIKYH